MAINSVTFSVSLPSKADRQVGYSFSAYCNYSSGTRPKTSSNILSASLYLNAINVYTSCNLDFGSYGVLPLSTQSGDASYSGGLSGFDASAMRNLAMSGGSMSGTITKSGSYSGNALNFRSTAGSLTITYEDNNASTGSLDKTTVEQSGEITLTVNKADYSYQHIATWRSSSGQTVQQNIGSGTSATFKVPANWSTGSATCVLQTQTSSGDFVGNYTLSFVVQIDTSTIRPTTGALTVALVQSAEVPASWGVFVKGLSKAAFSIPNASAGSNASFQSIDFTCGAQLHSSANEKSWTTDFITETGELNCEASVTNSYGNTAEATPQTITVYDYGDPQITSVIAFRCQQNGNASDSGEYISVKATAAYASVGNRNHLISFAVAYKKTIDENWSIAVPITSGSTTIIGGDLAGSGTYQVRVVAIDEIQNLRDKYTESIETVMTSDYTIHCLDGGYNVSFGMQGTIPMAIQLNPNWKFYHGTREVFLGELPDVDSVPTSGSTNLVQSGGVKAAMDDATVWSRQITIEVNDWEGTGPFTYYYENEWIIAKTTVWAGPSDEASAKAMVAGILITSSNGGITLSTSVIPTGTINLTIFCQHSAWEVKPFFVSKRGGGGGDYDAMTKFEIVDGVFNNIVALPNMLILSGNMVIAVFEAAFDAKVMASSAEIHALTVPEEYRPFVAQSFNGKRWDSENTESTLPIAIGTDGKVKLKNATDSGITFKRMQLFESWIRKQARMFTKFYIENGPSNVSFTKNEIIADTVNNKVVYKIDAHWSAYDLYNSNFLKIPAGFGPVTTVRPSATLYRTSGNITTDQYIVIGRNASIVSWQISFADSTGIAFELETDLYQEFVDKFISFNRTNVNYFKNVVEINPNTGKIRFQLQVSFDKTRIINTNFGTEIGFAMNTYNFKPKSLPGEYFEGTAVLENGSTTTVQCSLRGSSSSTYYACSLYVKSKNTSVFYGEYITRVNIDYTCDAYGY